MRFSKDENTYILAEFTTGDVVAIDIYRLSDDVKVVDGVIVSEISSTGTFKYLFNITVTEKTEFLLIMNNGTTDKRGKLVLGGYPDTILNDGDQVKSTVSGIQVDLDNPDQYKADISALSLESTTSAIKVNTDTINWADVEFIKEIEGGRWQIDKDNNQMVFYKSDNSTELARFNLLNEYGVADFENIFDRRRV